MAKRNASASSPDTLNELEQKLRQLEEIPKRLSILPLRDIVIFPYMIFPILIGRESSLRSITKALERDKFIFLTAQKDSSIEDPGKNDLHRYGTVAKIIQLIRLPNNMVKILVDGVVQGRIKRIYAHDDYTEGDIELNSVHSIDEDSESKAMVRHAVELFHEYVKVSQNVPPEVAMAFDNIDDPLRKLYYAGANLHQNVETKQRILAKFSPKEQFFEIISILASEIEVLQLEEDIDTRVHDTIQKAQRRFFIQEQIRALQQELGEDDDAYPDLAKVREKIDSTGMPETAKEKALEEFDKLKRMPSMAPDFAVIRNYLDWLTALPWSEETADNLDINRVQRILTDDHYGLEPIKQRILEYISVLKLVQSVHGQVLCFVGPPGVGKTSLAKSIAKALDRKFVRISLGGVRDEAEIRGHRRTYIGSMPGKIIQSMKRAGTVNPVILLDEVDKMSMDFRGDPSSALLEVLDPEQNSTFNDHYLEVDYDLSKALFITTANVKYDIPLPLLDRMEVIQLNSYLSPEKLQIAKRHLLPKQIERHGLAGYNVTISDGALKRIIREYTKEAGVRDVERQISAVLRKIAKNIIEDTIRERRELEQKNNQHAKAGASQKESKKKRAERLDDLAQAHAKKRRHSVGAKSIEQLLKAPPFRWRKNETVAKIGVVTGLAWTSVGGDIMPIEVTMMPGKDKLTLTGKLGDVMKESAMAALSFVRSNASRLQAPEDFYKDRDIHIHVPEGAIPKDGPSAGITMTMALISAAANKPVRGDVAMTGEVTLRGNILAIGGLNEKLVAAKSAGISTVLIPKENEPNLADLDEHISEGMEIIPVATVTEALPYVFGAIL